MKHNLKILVVDDEPATATLVAEILRGAGYTVTTAHDGFKAVAACKVRSPDLILLDLNMPLFGGIDVFNRLRAEERTRDIPVIFLSSKGEIPPRIREVDPAEHEFIFKPVEASELVQRVRTAFKVKALRDEIRKKEGQIRELTLVDPLTSLRTARYLHEFLQAEIAQCRRYSLDLSLIVLEIDRQKELAKSYSHSGLESLLAQVAAVISRQSRQADLIARLGGGEFALALPHTSSEAAVEVAERLRNAIVGSTFAVGQFTLKVSATLGICQLAPNMDGEGKTLIAHARSAVAQGHADGGNITLIAS